MTTEQVYELYRRALQSEDRESVLQQAGDLRAEVEHLLKAHDAEDDGFLDSSALDRMATLQAGTRVGRYTIVCEIGRGGAGRVYEAIQEQPRRRVALKLMRYVDERFEQEAELLARLDHPGIASVYEAGRFEGAAFVALQFVEGETLLEWARDRTLSERIDLMRRICEAVQHGHSRQIIHRDLKPQNVLVSATGPKVIDFGIAAMSGDRTDASGTPGYMAPEQVDPAPVDARTDVYSLGKLLLDLTKHTAISADLAAVIARASEPQPEARYPTASALANDLARLLAHEPVSARRASTGHQIALFMRRRPALATSIVCLAAALILGVTTSLRFAFEASEERDAALTAQRAMEVQAYIGQIALAQAALREHDVVEARRRLAATPPARRGWEWRHLQTRLDHADEIIEPEIGMFWGAVSPTGARLVAVGEAGNGVGGLFTLDLQGGQQRLWKFESTQPLCVDVDAAGRHAAMGTSDGRVLVIDLDTGTELREFRHGQTHINAVCFSPDGTHVISASRDGTVQGWDTTHEQAHTSYPRHPDRVICAACLADGGVLTGCRDGTVSWFRASKPPRTWRAHAGSVEGLAVSPDGTQVATVSRDQTLRIWDLASGKQVRVAHGHTDNIRSVAWHGAWIATASYDRTVRLWRATDLEPLATLRGHENLVRQVAFVNDEHFVSFSPDGSIRRWTVRPGGDVDRLRDVGGQVLDFAWQGPSLFVSTNLGALHRWEPRVGVEPVFERASGATTIRSDRERLHLRLEDGSVLTWQSERAPQLHTQQSSPFLVWDATRRRLYWREKQTLSCLAPDGTRTRHALPGSRVKALCIDQANGNVYSLDDSGTLAILDGGTAPTVVQLPVHEPTTLAVQRGGALLAVGLDRGGVLLIDGRTHQVLHRLQGHAGDVRSLAFHPSEPRLATGSSDETVRLWDTALGTQMAVFRAGIRIRRLAFSDDGIRLAAAGGGESGTQVLIWRSEAHPRQR